LYSKKECSFPLPLKEGVMQNVYVSFIKRTLHESALFVVDIAAVIGECLIVIGKCLIVIGKGLLFIVACLMALFLVAVAVWLSVAAVYVSTNYLAVDLGQGYFVAWLTAILAFGLILRTQNLKSKKPLRWYTHVALQFPLIVIWGIPSYVVHDVVHEFVSTLPWYVYGIGVIVFFGVVIVGLTAQQEWAKIKREASRS